MRTVLEPATSDASTNENETDTRPTLTSRRLDLASLLLEDPEVVESLLVRHFQKTCQFCKSSLPHWFSLCNVHATLTRSVIDPEYVTSLRREAQDARKREELYLSALPLVERAENGRAWIEAQQDQQKREAGKQKLDGIIRDIPDGLKTITLERLREIITFTSNQVVYYNTKIELVTSWSDRIIEILGEVHDATSLD